MVKNKQPNPAQCDNSSAILVVRADKTLWKYTCNIPVFVTSTIYRSCSSWYTDPSLLYTNNFKFHKKMSMYCERNFFNWLLQYLCIVRLCGWDIKTYHTNICTNQLLTVSCDWDMTRTPDTMIDTSKKMLTIYIQVRSS